MLSFWWWANSAECVTEHPPLYLSDLGSWHRWVIITTVRSDLTLIPFSVEYRHVFVTAGHQCRAGGRLSHGSWWRWRWIKRGRADGRDGAPWSMTTLNYWQGRWMGMLWRVYMNRGDDSQHIIAPLTKVFIKACKNLGNFPWGYMDLVTFGKPEEMKAASSVNNENITSNLSIMIC